MTEAGGTLEEDADEEDASNGLDEMVTGVVTTLIGSNAEDEEIDALTDSLDITVEGGTSLRVVGVTFEDTTVLEDATEVADGVCVLEDETEVADGLYVLAVVETVEVLICSETNCGRPAPFAIFSLIRSS